MLTTLEIRAQNAPEPAAPNPPYVAREGYPFTVIESAEADELFAMRDTCTNRVAGYTVTYPDTWYTNTEIGGWPACNWFSPTFYEVGDDPNEVPPEVAIVLTFAEMSFGHTDEPEYSVGRSSRPSIDSPPAGRS